LVALWHLDGDDGDAAGPRRVAADDPALLYSPGNWASGTAVNPGAYFSLLYRNCDSMTLRFEVRGDRSYAQIAYRIDRGPFVTANVADAVALALPARRSQPRLLEVVLKSNYVVYRNAIGHPNALSLLSIEVGAGASLSPPQPQPATVLVFGDSITVGSRAVANTGIDPDDSDATRSYAFLLRDALAAEVGVVAFPGTGVQTSTPYAPALVESCGWVFEGAPRDYGAIAPALVIFLEGFNDGGAAPGAIARGLAGVITQIRSASPASRFLVVGDVGGTRASEARDAAAVTGAAYSGSVVSMLQHDDDTLDAIHPTATTHVTKLLPAIARAVRQNAGPDQLALDWVEAMEWEVSP
ncbi:MAG: SGNH/GDSL hydrolase family protein, partial [Vicinamibacterales bacterium]